MLPVRSGVRCVPSCPRAVSASSVSINSRRRTGRPEQLKLGLRVTSATRIHFFECAWSHGIDTIVHLAAVLAPVADRDPSTGFSVNVGGMLNVLETARTLKLRKVVWASSAGIFSGLPRDRMIANESPVAPVNIYQATKVACEVLAGHYNRTFGVDSVGLRWPTLLSIRPSGGRAAQIGEA